MLLAPLALCACASPSMQGLFAPQPTPPAATESAAPKPPEPVETLDETPAPPPRPEARTVEEFDTTSAEDRAEALAVNPEPAGERRLGFTVGSLGSPTDPGIWVKTPLVSKLTAGRVEVAATGKSANIELRPSGGDAGSGSQVSLAAMRLLGVGLTELPELVLYAP